MEKAYKIRIYPNKTQQKLLHKTFGCVRYIYNHFLAKRKEVYEQEHKTLNYCACSKELTKLKQELEWLKEPDKCALQNALKDLDAAFKRFFKEKRGYPRFKRKNDHHQSYRSNYSNNNISFLGNKLKLPKLGKVRCRGYESIEGRILNATISQEPSGKYYVSLCVTVEKEALAVFPKTGKAVGLDLGISDFYITSDGEKLANPKYLKASLLKLKRLQKALSRKTSGGANWKKNRIKVARLYEYIRNQRRDYIQKAAKKLMEKYDIVCMETLRIQNMMKNHKLARNIGDVSWYQFSEALHYKADWNDKKLVKIDTFYPSSQTCSCCGHKNKAVKDLTIREWICPICNTTHDRDINAAKNILTIGLESIA